MSTMFCAADAKPCVLLTTCSASPDAPETTAAANPEASLILTFLDSAPDGAGASASFEALWRILLIRCSSACTYIREVCDPVQIQRCKPYVFLAAAFTYSLHRSEAEVNLGAACLTSLTLLIRRTTAAHLTNAQAVLWLSIKLRNDQYVSLCGCGGSRAPQMLDSRREIAFLQ